MKNKVDIRKLIEKKYKANTLELSDLLEEIDLVLQESIPDYQYRREGQPGYLEETDPGNARDIANRKNGNIIEPSNPSVGAPRHEKPDEPGYGDNVNVKPEVIPTTVAEAEKTDAISPEVIRKLPVMDLFSLITNSQMQLGSDERDMINSIVANMGGTQDDSWKQRIKLLQNYSNRLGTAQRVDAQNISSAVSTLIFLNLLKKLSYFMAQPSKQFEYVMAPLIAPDAEVLPNDEDITDVKLSSGKGYSIKFFPGSNPIMKGSISNLKKYEKDKGGLEYIVGRPYRTGMLQFGEIRITTNLNTIPETSEFITDISDIANRKGCFFFLTNQVPKMVCYVLNPGGATPDQIAKKFAKTIVTEPIKRQKIPQTAAQEQAREANSILQRTAPLKNYIDKLSPKKGNPEPLKSAEINTLLRIANDLQGKLTDLIQPLQDFKNSNKDINSQKVFVNSFINIVKSYLQSLKSQAPSSIAENLEIHEEEEETKKIVSEGQFSFDLPAKLWQYMYVDSLELGNPNKYNSQMLKLSDSVSKSYKTVLDNLEDLNRNLTQYFATTEKSQKKALEKARRSQLPGEEKDTRGFAQKSIDNASSIVSGVTEIRTSKGEVT